MMIERRASIIRLSILRITHHALRIIPKTMFHSIRWRLIASFTLLTLLTVTLLGVIVLTLMQRTLEREATAYLNANAQAVARQSQVLFQPALQRAVLAQLAHAWPVCASSDYGGPSRSARPACG
jgi:hypothetical protein